MTTHQCPLCGAAITREMYERVLRIDEARTSEQAHRDAAFKAKVADLETHRNQIISRAVAAARKQGDAQAARDKTAEKERYSRELQGLREELRAERTRRNRDEIAWKERLARLQRKAEDRDRAHFGADGEEPLEAALNAAFRSDGDKIERHGKGGDVLHFVIDEGTRCGTIVYECKHSAEFDAKDVRQLKTAMARHDTKYGLLVCRTLPAGRTGMHFKDGVLAVEPHLAATVARVLRHAVVGVHRARLSQDGELKKTAEIYEYLRSDAFGNAIARIQDRVVRNRTVLDRERSAHLSWWREREESDAVIFREAGNIESRIKEIIVAPDGRNAADDAAADVA